LTGKKENLKHTFIENKKGAADKKGRGNGSAAGKKIRDGKKNKTTSATGVGVWRRGRGWWGGATQCRVVVQR